MKEFFVAEKLPASITVACKTEKHGKVAEAGSHLGASFRSGTGGIFSSDILSNQLSCLRFLCFGAARKQERLNPSVHSGSVSDTDSGPVSPRDRGMSTG